MPPDATAADNTPLTIDQAVAHLDAAEKREDEAPAEAAQPERIEAEPAAEDASEPVTATDGEDAETEDSTEEADEAELPAIEPPRFWDAQAKDRFRELPRDLQELVLAKETERDTATSKAIQKSADARKAAETEASKIAQITGHLDKLLPQAEQTFKSRWEGVDWNAVVDTYGAEQALKLRNDFEREQATVQQLQAAKAQADQIQFAQFVEAETAKLPDLAPDLVDPVHGGKRRGELGQYLAKAGVPTEAIRHMSALETSVAYKAFLWDEAQAQAKAKSSAPKAPAKIATAAKPTVRPTATPARSGSPNQARINTLSRKPSLTMDEAVELLDLQEST